MESARLEEEEAAAEAGRLEVERIAEEVCALKRREEEERAPEGAVWMLAKEARKEGHKAKEEAVRLEVVHLEEEERTAAGAARSEVERLVQEACTRARREEEERTARAAGRTLTEEKELTAAGTAKRQAREVPEEAAAKEERTKQEGRAREARQVGATCTDEGEGASAEAEVERLAAAGHQRADGAPETMPHGL